MKIPRTIREIKFHQNSVVEALETLKPLKLEKPVIKKVADTYLESKNRAKKIYETDGEIFFVEVSEDKESFAMEFSSISEEEKKLLLEENKVDRVMKKKRTIWNLDGIKVAIDEVKGLGVFIEIQGKKREELVEILSRIDVKESELVTSPYNKL